MITHIDLHLGAHKTGTTSIQETFAASRALLAAHGWLYPYFNYKSYRENNHSFPLYLMAFEPGDNRNTNPRFTTAEKKEARETYIGQLHQQIRAFEGHRIILSAEDASLLPAYALERLKALLMAMCPHVEQIRVLYTIRHPVQFWTSLIQERVKSGIDFAKLRAFIEAGTGGFAPAVQRAQTVFGRDNLRLLRFEDLVAGKGGLVCGFLQALSPDLPQLPELPQGKNQAISLEAVHLMDAINAAVPLWQSGSFNPEKKGFLPDDMLGFEGVPFALDAPLQQLIWERYGAQTNAICRDHQLTAYTNTAGQSIPYAELWNTTALQHLQIRLNTASTLVKNTALRMLVKDFNQYKGLFQRAKRRQIRMFLAANGMPTSPLTRLHIKLRKIQYQYQPPSLGQQYRFLKHTHLFDPSFYLQTYLDIGAAGVDPLMHYLQLGWKEGRNPSPLFSTDGYLNRYPEVAATSVNPLWHFLAIGCHEGVSLHQP